MGSLELKSEGAVERLKSILYQTILVIKPTYTTLKQDKHH